MQSLKLEHITGKARYSREVRHFRGEPLQSDRPRLNDLQFAVDRVGLVLQEAAS